MSLRLLVKNLFYGLRLLFRLLTTVKEKKDDDFIEMLREELFSKEVKGLKFYVLGQRFWVSFVVVWDDEKVFLSLHLI